MKTLLLLGHVTATDLPQFSLYVLCAFIVGFCLALILPKRHETSETPDGNGR